MSMLALVRHGQTEWNRVGMFTGWSDEPLNELGRVHAKHAGVILAGIAEHWQVAYTSALARARDTALLALDAMGGPPADLMTDWLLNERHVGDLEGRTHASVAAEHGQAAFDNWRWGWNHRPPTVSADDPRQREHVSNHPGADLPAAESLVDVIERVRPWLARATAQVAAGSGVVAFTHGTTVRALRVLIEQLSPAEAFDLRPANGGVVAYRFDDGRFVGA